MVWNACSEVRTPASRSCLPHCGCTARYIAASQLERTFVVA
jgi:hypothetical protein